MATINSVLFEGLDAINYSDGYAHTSADTPRSRVDITPADIRYKNAPAGVKISPNSMVGQHEGGKALIDITNCLNRDQRLDIYGSMKNLYRPMYGAADEAYFNYLKGYVGSFLWSPFDWYSTGDDVGFFEYFHVNIGNLWYQAVDMAKTDETFGEAVDDWWEQQKGVLDATWDSADIRDELRDTYTSVELDNDDKTNVHVIAGFDSDGNFVVKFDADKSQAFCDGGMLVQTGAGSVTGIITQYAYFGAPGGFGINMYDGGDALLTTNFSMYNKSDPYGPDNAMIDYDMLWGSNTNYNGEVQVFSTHTGNIYEIGPGSYATTVNMHLEDGEVFEDTEYQVGIDATLIGNIND